MATQTGRPRDTTQEARAMQMSALERIGPEGRVKVALELAEFVRAMHLAGLRSRHPDWSEERAIHHIVATQYGVDLRQR